MEDFYFILNTVFPVFLLVGLGYLLKKKHLINDLFVQYSSKLVFTVSLPALIFSEVSAIDFSNLNVFSQVAFVYAGTFFSLGLGWLIAVPLMKVPTDKTVFIQGAFRGNFAIVGIALLSNILGAENLGKSSLILAFTIPLYNILSVIVLTVPLHKKGELHAGKIILAIVRNPLILGVLLALPFSYFSIPIPFIMSKSISYLADMTLPLALLGIGGFLNFADLRNTSGAALISSSIKIILVPAAASAAAYLFGFRNDDLLIIFILFGCPTAVASFIMAEAMGSNSRLAAGILLMTTLGSVLTIALGLYILRSNNLI